MTHIYAITFLLAAASIAYELLAAHALSLLAANTVFWYSVTIGIYLGAMGAGALYSDRVFGRKDVRRKLLAVELRLAAAGALSIPALSFAHVLFTYLLQSSTHVIPVFAVFPLVSVGVIFTIGFLTGIELPLLIRIAEEKIGAVATEKVLAADYAGALAGALAVPLVLLPFMSVFAASFTIALVNVAVIFLILAFLIPRGAFLLTDVFFSGLLSSSLILGLFASPAIEQFFLKKYYYYRELSGITALFNGFPHLPDIERTRTPYQMIDVFRHHEKEYPKPLIAAYSDKYEKNPNYPRTYFLFLNGDYQILSDVDEIYHEWFAHIPVMLSGAIPESVLILGGGDGILAKELLKYEEIEKITLVEIDAEMMRLARTHPALRTMNGGAFDDPRVEVIVEDAYHYAQTARDAFDAVYVDFPFAKDYTLSRLYSREFYEFLKNLAGSDGYVVLDAPGAEFYARRTHSGATSYAPGEMWETYYHTVLAAGFGTIVPYATVLEADNEQALRAVEIIKIGQPGEEAGADNAPSPTRRYLLGRANEPTLERFADSVSQGFIFLKKGSGAATPKFRDTGVELHALNKRRFALALGLPYPKPPDVDRGKVNSIMRPAIPRINPANVIMPRLPY